MFFRRTDVVEHLEKVSGAMAHEDVQPSDVEFANETFTNWAKFNLYSQNISPKLHPNIVYSTQHIPKTKLSVRCLAFIHYTRHMNHRYKTPRCKHNNISNNII